MEYLSLTVNIILKFMLIFLRVSIIISMLPVFGSRNVPFQLRIGFSLVLAMLLVPVITAPDLSNYRLSTLAILVSKEVLIGAIYGFMLMLVFMGIQISGQVIGMQMGFSLVQVLDPQSQMQISLISEFNYIVAVLLLLATNGHHYMIEGLVQSFSLVPVDRLKLPSPAIFQLVKDTGLIFVIAIKIGAPVIMSLLVTSVALGLIARTIPQMNVFIVGFPLKIGMALIVLGFSFPFFSEVFHRSWEMIKSDTNLLLQALGA